MRNIFLLALLTPILALSVIIAPHSVAAQDCIPEGTVIDSAIFSIYLENSLGNTVNIHRITAPWDEMTVTWNNFAGNYDPAIEGSFVADVSSWHSVDLTSLVQDWLDGVYPNYGILLEQGLPSGLTAAKSSEDATPALRPELEICYTTSTGQTCIIIQRPGIEQDGVADSYIWEWLPYNAHGSSNPLYMGIINGSWKQALISFNICEEPNNTCEELGTPGYWKNHPDAWPVNSLTLGAYTYTKTELLAILHLKTKNDASIILEHHLIAAKLNILSGSDPSPVADTILDADALLIEAAQPLPFPLPDPPPLSFGVKQKTDLGREMLAVKTVLDDYNNGYLTGDCIPPVS